MGGVGATAGEGGEDNAVAEVHVPHLNGREKQGCHGRVDERGAWVADLGIFEKLAMGKTAMT